MKTVVIPEEEAQEWIDSYLDKLEKIDKERQRILDTLDQLGYDNRVQVVTSHRFEDVSSHVSQASEISESDPIISHSIDDETLVDHSNYQINSEYDEKGWVWSDKIEYALKKEQIVLKINQIVSMLSEIDSGIRENQDVAKRSIATTVSRKIKKGKVFNKVSLNSHHDTYYGLKEWFEEGKVDSNRLPKK